MSSRAGRQRQAGGQLPQRLIAQGQCARHVGWHELAGDQDVVIPEHRMDRRAHARTHEGAARLPQEAWIPGGVEIRAVVERVGIARQLDAVVAVRAAAGADRATAQDAQRPGQLVSLVVVDEVPALNDRVGLQVADGTGGGGQHLNGERLLRSEGRLERITQAVEERNARRRGGVQDVGVGDVGQCRDHPGDRPRAAEFGAGDQPLAGTGPERPRPGGIAPGRGERGAGPGGTVATSAAARTHERAGAQADRLSPGDPSHGPLNPAITLSRVAWRVTQAIASSPAASSPARTSAISLPVAPSDSVT